MKKILIIIGILIAVVIITIVSLITYYNRSLRAVDPNNDEIIEVVVPTGSNYSTMANILYEHDLIRSPFTFKIYVSLNPPEKQLYAGVFMLSQNMSVSEIIEALGEGPAFDYNTERLVIPEGFRMDQIAARVAPIVGSTEEEVLDRWSDEEFLDIVMERYWFVTNDIKKKGIRFPLEGYFFPETYQVLKSSTIDQIAFVLLDQMEMVLEKYREGIESSDLSIHEILTMASIVHHEAGVPDDKAKIASVFFNRLARNMRLQTDPTVGYAVWRFNVNFYTREELNVDSPYNTYMYPGLPIGPIGNPGEASIKAVINPASTSYIFFMADICSGDPKTIFAVTYAEHSANVCKYLGCPRKC